MAATSQKVFAEFWEQLLCDAATYLYFAEILICQFFSTSFYIDMATAILKGKALQN